MSTYQNMGKTMLSLFDQFDSSELCQLYIYPSVPDTKKCNSYFRVTDKDVLSAYYKFHVSGREIIPDINFHSQFTNEQDEKLYSNKKNQYAQRKIARDLMWKFSRWYNKKLANWLNREHPDCIFLAPGEAKFIYNIALKISKKLNIPIVVYICDEYYFVKKSNNAITRIQQNLLHRKMEKLFSNTSHIITICDELSDIYSKKFNVPSTKIMTGTNYPIADTYVFHSDPCSITYMGNVSCNRHKSLIEIGQALDGLNSEYSTNYSLNIYTSTKDPDIISSFEKVKSISLCGYLSGEEFNQKFHSSDFLLHTEGFDEASIDRVKHSVSTKIADSLGSGIPLIAYGPSCVSSMQHLIRNDCAILITNKDDLYKSLFEVFKNYDLRKTTVDKALQTTRKNHLSEINSNRLYNVIKNLLTSN